MALRISISDTVFYNNQQFSLNLTPNLYYYYFLFIYEAGVESSPLLRQPIIDLLYQPWLMDSDDCGSISGMNEWQGKLKYSKRACPSAALSTTDPT
jgi:hypothetical protein